LNNLVSFIAKAQLSENQCGFRKTIAKQTYS